MAESEQPERQSLLRRGGPLLWGLLASGGAFATQALALALVPGGPQLTKNIVGLVAAASLVPGLVAAAQTRDADRTHRAASSLRKELRERTAKADRVTASEAFGELAQVFDDFIQSKITGHAEVEPIDIKVVQVLGETLAGPNHTFLWPLRIAFLRRMPDEPRHTTGEPERLLLEKQSGRAWGHQPRVIWTVPEATDDANVAKLIMEGSPPYRDRGFLITDVDQPTYDGRLWLKSPEVDGSRPPRSYCRVAVTLPPFEWGILCADTWSETPLSDADKKVIYAFADILATILTAVERSHDPVPTDISEADSGPERINSQAPPEQDKIGDRGGPLG